MTSNVRFVTLAATIVITPASTKGTLPAMRHLAAIAMLVVERDEDERWTFDLRSQAIGAGDGEDILLRWATHALPDAGTAIGWQLADRIVAPLLDAAAVGDPELTPPFLDRLIRLVSGPSIDLAIRHGGAAAPPFDEIAAAADIATEPMNPARIETAWAIGDTAALVDHARAQAIAAWRLWLAEAPPGELPARAAFECWLASEHGNDPQC